MGSMVLVTGATGYVGGRLVKRLLDRGHSVRCLVRNTEGIKARPWISETDVVQGDALNYDSLVRAMEGIEIAYYLIRSQNSDDLKYVERTRRAAENFGRAAARCGVKRIIYLGPLSPHGIKLSHNLLSRIRRGDYLRESGVPVTEFRAGLIIGSGSVAFELIRYLTERSPIQLTPHWVDTKTQPIAVRNVLEYLVKAIDVEESTGKVIEIGGEEVLTFGQMMRIYARIRNLKRSIIPVPLDSPAITSRWVSLITPVRASVARQVIDVLQGELTIPNGEAKKLFNVRLRTYADAVRLALRRFNHDSVETMWSDAISTSVQDSAVFQRLSQTEGMIVARFRRAADADLSAVFAVVSSLGGETGWLYANSLWRIRGFLDVLAGGVGSRRSRRSSTQLRVGDAVDFWRVESVEENRLLRLRAEMRLPGKAWLQFELQPLASGRTRITQTAFYEPRGLLGAIYWYLMYLPHKFIFPGILREISRRAENMMSGGSTMPSTERRNSLSSASSSAEKAL